MVDIEKFCEPDRTKTSGQLTMKVVPKRRIAAGEVEVLVYVCQVCQTPLTNKQMRCPCCNAIKGTETFHIKRHIVTENCPVKF